MSSQFKKRKSLLLLQKRMEACSFMCLGEEICHQCHYSILCEFFPQIKNFPRLGPKKFHGYIHAIFWCPWTNVLWSSTSWSRFIEPIIKTNMPNELFLSRGFVWAVSCRIPLIPLRTPLPFL